MFTEQPKKKRFGSTKNREEVLLLRISEKKSHTSEKEPKRGDPLVYPLLLQA